MERVIIISYYTPGAYEKVINTRLRPSLEKWGLKHYIEKVEDKGDWYRNTSYKSKFVQKCLKKFKEDVVFLDSDATIEEFPELLYNIPENVDVSMHRLDWIRFWRGKTGGNNFHMLSGTMFMRYNRNVLEVVEDWVEQCDNAIGTWEQKILQQILEETTAVNFMDLPASYCAIVKTDGTVPEYVGKPVILHWQASRKYKTK